MVYYFKSNTVEPTAYIYAGKDKVENEELIKYGFEEDVWLPEGESWDDIPKDLLEDCAQLTKANSIDGNKKDNITVIYTPWSNLKKDGSMAVGQVGFHDQRKVKRIHVVQRLNPIVNRLNKTKEEKHPDLRQEKEDRQRELRNRDRAAHLKRQKAEKEKERENREKRYQKEHAYDDLFSEDAVAANSNENRNSDFEEDFM